MKRMLIIICALILFLALSDDGQIGKVTFVAPLSSIDFLNCSSEESYSAKADSWAGLTPANYPSILSISPSQPAPPIICHISKILISSYHSSAGGIPR